MDGCEHVLFSKIIILTLILNVAFKQKAIIPALYIKLRRNQTTSRYNKTQENIKSARQPPAWRRAHTTHTGTTSLITQNKL
jgi:hypothetical protein